jgi:hypothetical protein
MSLRTVIVRHMSYFIGKTVGLVGQNVVRFSRTPILISGQPHGDRKAIHVQQQLQEYYVN